MFSYDSPLHRFDFLEITGTEATLALPNPNTYSGRSMLRRAGDPEWTPMPEPTAVAGRGIGGWSWRARFAVVCRTGTAPNVPSTSSR